MFIFLEKSRSLPPQAEPRRKQRKEPPIFGGSFRLRRAVQGNGGPTGHMYYKPLGRAAVTEPGIRPEVKWTSAEKKPKGGGEKGEAHSGRTACKGRRAFRRRMSLSRSPCRARFPPGVRRRIRRSGPQYGGCSRPKRRRRSGRAARPGGIPPERHAPAPPAGGAAGRGGGRQPHPGA